MHVRIESDGLDNRNNIAAVEEIVGFKRDGQKIHTETSAELRRRGTYWARHVLEVPVAWIMYAAHAHAQIALFHPFYSLWRTSLSEVK